MEVHKPLLDTHWVTQACLGCVFVMLSGGRGLWPPELDVASIFTGLTFNINHTNKQEQKDNKVMGVAIWTFVTPGP